MMRFWPLFIFLFLLSLPAMAAAPYPGGSGFSLGDAQSQCQADLQYYESPAEGYTNISCVYVPPTGGQTFFQVALKSSVSGAVYNQWTGTYVPPSTCSANVNRFGIAPHDSSGLDCHNGCEEEAFFDPTAPAGQTWGVSSTGKTCTVGSASTPADGSSAAPPPQAMTCKADGTCTWCDTQNGNCVTGKTSAGKPPAITGAQGGTSSPPPPNLGSTGNPASGSSSGGTGSGGTVITGNGGPQPANNGDWAKGPAHATSAGCTAGDACNAGQASGVVGTLYQASGDSIGQEYSSFKAQVSSSPLISAASGFFAFTPSGSCPTWHIPGNKYWGEAGFDFTFFCDPAILAILQAAGLIVLAVGAFSAFRIALY